MDGLACPKELEIYTSGYTQGDDFFHYICKKIHIHGKTKTQKIYA
jgi:hypothetical protein